MEKVLYYIMHHQYTPEILFSVIQKYGKNISNQFYDYFELLCPNKYEKKVNKQFEFIFPHV